MSTLFAVGVSWRHAPLEVRERFACDADAIATLLARLVGAEVTEALVVSTCNRVEIYGMAAPASAEAALTRAQQLLLAHAKWPPGQPPPLQSRAGDQAVRHLFRVAAALDSLVVGEPQILGQLKDGLRLARARGTVGPQLEHWVAQAERCARKVRRETALGRGAASVASVAAQLAGRVFGSLEGRTVLLVGAGKMSRLTARHLVASGARSLVVVNRSMARAEQLATAVGGVARAWDELPSALGEADIVVSSTGAASPVLTAPVLERVAQARQYAPLVLVDIAVPRDVQSEVRELDGVFLYDIDDLERVVAATMSERQAAARVADNLVEREASIALAASEHAPVKAEAAAVAAALTAKLGALAEREVASATRRLARSSEPEAVKRELERLMHRVVRKVLHQPLVRLKYAPVERQHELGLALRELFGLTEATAREKDDP